MHEQPVLVHDIAMYLDKSIAKWVILSLATQQTHHWKQSVAFVLDQPSTKLEVPHLACPPDTKIPTNHHAMQLGSKIEARKKKKKNMNN